MTLPLAVLLLSGCGVLTKQELKPAPKTLTHGRLVYLADRACAADLRHDRALKRPTDVESFVKGLKAEIKSGEHLIFVLRGLTPPAADAVAYRRFLAAENGEDLVANHLLDAIGNAPLRRIKHYFKRGLTLGKRAEARAKRLGMHICAKD